MAGFFGVLLFGYLALVLAMYLFQRSLLYHPGQAIGTPSAAGLPEMAVVTLDTADGLALASWYRAAAPGLPTLIYLHGNAGSIAGREEKVRPYLDVDFGVLLVEYRGFGGNPGQLSQDGLLADAESAIAFLGNKGVGPAQIVLYGESLGTGVATLTAARLAKKGTPVAALVLEAPFTSIAEMARVHYPYLPGHLLVKDRWASVEVIAEVATPVLVIHGEKDRTVPFSSGLALFEAAGEPKEFIAYPDAGHADLYDFDAQSDVLRFLRDRACCS